MYLKNSSDVSGDLNLFEYSGLMSSSHDPFSHKENSSSEQLNHGTLSLHQLSNSLLHEKLLNLSSEERKLTLEVLEHLREVERRRLYAERGHSSLFEYVVKELHYSESAAQRRIFAMRALRELPELESKVESGELKVTQLAQVQSFFRAESKAGKSYSLDEKRELIQSTIGKSTRETEKILAEKSPESLIKEKVRAITQTLTQLSFTADEALMENLQAVRDRFAHRLPAGASLAEVIRFMAKVTLDSAPEKKLTHKKQRAEEPTKQPEISFREAPFPKSSVLNHSRENSVSSNLLPTNPLPAPVVASRYIPAQVKRIVWNRDQGRCTYISPITKKRCESRHRLQVDHILPFSLGGSSRDPNGLRLLCFTHNQHEAVRILRQGKNPRFPVPKL